MTSFSLRVAAALLAWGLAGSARAQEPSPHTKPEATPAYTNRLVHSADPYLLLHAHNPVDWYPWGPEALAKARAEGKPIFLSVGYSTCYWCHVAEKTIYSDPAIAKLMNEWFVNVKVDREERPDVDRLYMDATTMLDGHGAWPNNLFLTPEGAPFYAGSYFPPKDDGDQPGFPKVLAAIHDLWVNHRAEQVTPAATEMMKALHTLADRQDEAGTLPVVPRAWLSTAAQMLLPGIDPANGGLGSPKSGPKFPQAPALALLAADARLDEDQAAAAALQTTLDAMAFGGIDDQLGGGFFRYATEPTWSVPHFEKMLSDNAQMLALYTARAKTTGGALDGGTALAVAGFLLRDMQLPGGGFATALDAETAGVEGETYLWTRQQIEDVLGAADTERFLGVYELTPLPEQRGGETALAGLPAGVLRIRLPIADTLKRAGAANPASLIASMAQPRAKLLAARAARPQPARDDKVVVGWNGLAIGALAGAGKTLASPALTVAAVKAGALIWDHAWDQGTGALEHQIFDGTAAVDGTPEDYAALGVGYLDLADATGDATWRQRAGQLADAMLKRFLQPDGRFQAGAGLLPVALGDNEDADLPSGTSSALELLGRLAAEPDGARFAAAQARMATRLAGTIGTHPATWPSAVVALAEHPPSQAALAAAAPPKPVRVASTEQAVPAAPHVPATSDHVHASASTTTMPDGQVVTVTLDVDPGFHINAHLPSLDYLVPTDLAFAGVTAGSVAYPSPLTFQTEFSKTALAVYEGAVKLTATLPKDATDWHATVTAQACDAHTCLPPSTLPVVAPKPGG